LGTAGTEQIETFKTSCRKWCDGKMKQQHWNHT